MINWFNRNYRTIIISAFLIPIITVALVSISHVTIWYGISNPISWAIYLSIGIEIAAMSALAAISANMGRKVYFPFGIVTLIQFIGNIFFAYNYIDLNGETFKAWVELVSPLLEYIGIESSDFVGHKRFLALFAGGLLPIISLSFLHMLVKFSEEIKIKKDDKKDIDNTIESKDIVSEVSRLRLSDDELSKIENLLLKTQKPDEKLDDKSPTYNDVINEDIGEDIDNEEETLLNSGVTSDTDIDNVNMDIQEVVQKDVPSTNNDDWVEENILTIDDKSKTNNNVSFEEKKK